MKDKTLKKQSKTDFARLEAMKDEDINYTDIPPLREGFFREAGWWTPVEKKTVTIRLDSDVLDWLKKGGKGYQTRVNKILRAIMEQQRDKNAA